jgi:hypothetical protein
MGNKTDASTGHNSSRTNAGKIQVSTTVAGQKMMARALRGRGTGGTTTGDTNPQQASMGSGLAKARGKMDFSQRNKKKFTPPDPRGGGIG